jgi:hypothetical protein
MATYTKYETFIQQFCDMLIDYFGTTHVYKALIHTDAPTVATDANATTDLTQIAGSNGYTTNGNSITFNSTRTGGIVTATATDVVWTASGGNLGASTTGRYVSYFDDNHATKQLVASWDYGTTFTIADTETLTLDFGVSLATVQ